MIYSNIEMFSAELNDNRLAILGTPENYNFSVPRVGSLDRVSRD